MNEVTIRGARQHHLKNLTVAIPKGKFTVITGGDPRDVGTT